MTESRQNDTVENFRAGEYKVLVTTSVGSEGIDVPDCNIVLSYNYTGNEIQRIQMAGNFCFMYLMTISVPLYRIYLKQNNFYDKSLILKFRVIS